MNKEKRQIPNTSLEQLLKERYARPETAMRTRYDTTIKNLEAVFDKDSLHFEIFENLFNKSGMDRLSSFLGLPPDYSRISVKETARPTKQTVNQELRREIAQHYEPVYRFCAERFPAVRELWPSFELLR